MGGECPRCGAPLEGAACSYCGYVEPQETQNSRMENGLIMGMVQKCLQIVCPYIRISNMQRPAAQRARCLRWFYASW